MKYLKFVLMLAIIGGCVHVNKSIISDNPTGTIFPKESVYVYFETDSIPSHIRVAIMTGKGSDEWTNESHMIDKLRMEAGKLGANAIILKGVKDPSAGRKFVGALLGTGSSRKGDAIAIYVPSLDVPADDTPESEPEPELKPEPEPEPEIVPENQPTEVISKIVEKKSSWTKLPNLRKALPELNKFTDIQIIDAYRKNMPVFINATNAEIIKTLEEKYSP